METSYRYGLFIDGIMVEDFPSTLEGFREAIRKSNSILKDDEEHEVKVFEISE